MEALMQYVWQFRLWPLQAMRTVDGQRIQVLDPGVLNRDAGPDFFNAKIMIGGQHWSGNVEIHVRASDWFRHHHDHDNSYDSVILHVVDVDDASVFRSNGEKIPQMVMRCTPDFAQRYHNMVNNPMRELPCAGEVKSIPQIYIDDWISALAFERLYAKTDRIRHLLSVTQGDWNETIYIVLARALGFGTNSDPFQLLAQSTPLRVMLHHADSLLSVEALLFGQAGLLEAHQQSQDPYVNRLVNEYRFLCAKYSLRRSENIVWKMARMRPQNFPHRRIALLARLVHQNPTFSRDILEAADEQQARKIFDVALDGYWQSHFTFSSEGVQIGTRALSAASVDLLIINVIAPVLYAYSLAMGDLRRSENAVEVLQRLRPENNRIVQTFTRAGIDAPDAFTTQALIQLRREYCESRKCLYCRFGHRLLSAKVPRTQA